MIAPEVERELLLAAIRAASAEMQRAKLDLDAVGVALKVQAVSVSGALAWIEEQGSTPLIEVVMNKIDGRSETQIPVSEPKCRNSGSRS